MLNSSSLNILKVGLIGLHEAGNLGDDLIFAAAVRSIQFASPAAEIHFVGRGQDLALDRLCQPTSQHRVIRHRLTAAFRRLWPWVAFRTCDLVMLAGGGLIQSVHHPLRPYHWLAYAGPARRRFNTVAIGVGLGPLGRIWTRILKRRQQPLSACYVRDRESLAIARNVGWDAYLCTDFVDDDFLRSLELRAEVDAGRLGVALRAWKGLDAADIAQHIHQTMDKVGADSVRLYVLETHGPTGTDDLFIAEVARYLADTACVTDAAEIITYDPADPLRIIEDMATCGYAISMKLHASAIWKFTGAALFPVIYAPKVASFFGLPYRGLEVVRDPVEAPASASETLSASIVLGDHVRVPKRGGGDYRPLTSVEHVLGAVGSLLFDVWNWLSVRSIRSRLSLSLSSIKRGLQ